RGLARRRSLPGPPPVAAVPLRRRRSHRPGRPCPARARARADRSAACVLGGPLARSAGGLRRAGRTTRQWDLGDGGHRGSGVLPLHRLGVAAVSPGPVAGLAARLPPTPPGDRARTPPPARHAPPPPRSPPPQT